MQSETIELAQFFEMSLDLLVVAGFDGYFRRVNQTWASTLGWSPEEMLARPSIEFVHPDDRAETLVARGLIKDGMPLAGLVNRYLCKDGTFRWLEWRSIALIEHGLVYAAARDVTDQKLAEHERKQTQAHLATTDRLMSVGRLAGGVAHQINNPLSYIMANLRLVVDELQAPEGPHAMPRTELSTILLEALHGAERVKAIVQGLQALAEEDHTGGTIALKPVVELALTMVGSELRRRAKLIEVHGQTPLVKADSARLAQVLINLLLNAGQAIEAGTASTNEIRVVTSTDEAGRAVIEVHDTGAGIAPRVLPHIFDPFFTTRPEGKGSGLGLAMCHGIIKKMGGTIAVTTQEGQGSTFRITLPSSIDDDHG